MNGRAGMGVRGKGRRLSSLPCPLDAETAASALAGVEGAITPTHTQGRAALKMSPAKAKSIGFGLVCQQKNLGLE
jgi:hypothetical protein